MRENSCDREGDCKGGRIVGGELPEAAEQTHELIESKSEIEKGNSVPSVTVSPSPQSKDEENEKLHKLREYARDFRRQHTTDAEQFDWDSDDGDYGLAIGHLVVT
jgi:radical SAM superfamily enzyme YgiQ (UPF0313 family)